MQHSTKVIVALGVVYLGWGSSYHAIRIGVESVEPFLFCGVRFLIAGPALLLFAFYKGQRLPGSGQDWLILFGTLLLMQVIASGLVAWGQQWLTSSEAALIMSSAALWMAWLGSLGYRGDGVSLLSYAAITVGGLGLYLLVSSGIEGSRRPLPGYGAVLLAALSWSAGSVVLRRYTLDTQSLMTAALHMSIAGVILGYIGWVYGGGAESRWDSTTYAALFFLVVFNSLIAYGAYYWLIHAVKPVVLGTFAYVTPGVAIGIGVLFMDETLLYPQIIGSILILGSVVVSAFSTQRKSAGNGKATS